jgi:hypothetical protein
VNSGEVDDCESLKTNINSVETRMTTQLMRLNVSLTPKNEPDADGYPGWSERELKLLIDFYQQFEIPLVAEVLKKPEQEVPRNAAKAYRSSRNGSPERSDPFRR